MLAMGVTSTELRAQASGIVITKDSTAQPDGSAKVFEYTLIRKMGAVTNYSMPNGQSVQRTQFQPQFTVPYPDLMSRSIIDPNQLGSIENSIRSCRGLVTTYPRAAPYLNPHIQTSEEIIRRVKGGEVLFNGSFMPRSDYDALIRREEDSVNQHLEKSREKKRAAEAKTRRMDMETRRHKR